MNLFFRSVLFLTPLACFSLQKISDEFVVDLKNPKFNEGKLETSEGGIIGAKNLRIQAENISYFSTIEDGVPKRIVEASGNLFVVFKDKPFVADAISFDFATNTGVLYNGRTFVDFWYLGGKEIVLNPDGSFEAVDAFLTTSSNKNSSWELHSASMKVSKKRDLSANNLSLRLFKLPVFWLPVFKASLRFVKDPLIKYRVTWDKGIGPRATVRYQFFSTETFSAYLRADYRITSSNGQIKGALGGALETSYKSLDEKTEFLTRNFYANDRIVPQEKGPHRYRFQGVLKSTGNEERTVLYASWDKLSDQDMISDFKTDDFVVNTEKRSYLYFGHQERDALLRFSVQPKLNYFQSINEELPRLILNFRPQVLGSSGIISTNDMNLGYLNFAYARGLQEYLRPYHAYRMETNNELYRPVSFHGLNVTPKVGLHAIYYNNSPFHEQVGQMIYHWGLNTNIRFAKHIASFTHILEPYCDYNGYSRPWVGNDFHYVFYLDDGLSKLNTVELGLKQHFVFSGLLKKVEFNAFALSYCNGLNYPGVLGRYGGDLELIFKRFFIKAYTQYNQGAMRLDYINTQAAITFSEDFSVFFEYRNRGPYAWRRCDYQNYFLDVGRPNSELLLSPISDKRQTILGKIMLRISPRVVTQIAGHYGFGRNSEPSYKATKTDFIINVGGSWNAKISYWHSPNDDRFTTSFYVTP
jgi:hypothetical protein